MWRPKNVVTWTLFGALLSLVLPILVTVSARLILPDFRLIHVPLHSLMESSGGLVALAIAGVLFAEWGRRPDTSHYPWMIAGLASMGMLDLFHAATNPSNPFIWLHVTSDFAGGVLFALVWVSRFKPQFQVKPEAIATVLVLSTLVGLVSICRPDWLPQMQTAEGKFSTVALTLSICGGFGFLVAAAFFVGRFQHTHSVADWIFGMQTALSAAAGLLFADSILWDGRWWWWHLLRLAAYGLALGYGTQAFVQTERDLQLLNRQLNDANEALDRIVEERTARLRASEERFELAVRGSTDGIWDWNILTGELYYSPRVRELVGGYTVEEFPNEFSSFESILHPDDHNWVMRAIDDHLYRRVPYDVEYRLHIRSGEYRWFRARGQAVWNSKLEPLRMAGSITDVTESHRLRERFRLAVEASPTSLMMVHEDGRILMANSRSLMLFGYSDDELISQPIEMLIPEALVTAPEGHRQLFFQDSSSRTLGESLELFGVRKDGSSFPIRVAVSPVETDDGHAVICGILDITDQKKALETMRLAKETAESASLAKSSFLANMSHEIRTPMNGIIGMSQLLSQTELRSHQREYLTTVVESAHILLRLLNDILDFSKIEAGKLELECVDFRISECVAHASQMLLLRAAEKGLEIACRVSPEIPDHLRGDPGRVQQVLVNLLSNAVKFTEAGEIFVNINVDSIQGNRVRLHFSVTDTGIGISLDKYEQIFRPFEQAESSTTRRFGGTGLGLTISRQLVEMMRGRMWVESEPGRGSTFHFTAEFELAADQLRREPVELESLRNLAVLVVDDNLTNRRILCELLQYWHMHPVAADSAESARQAMQTAAAEHRPIRLILLDHHMPGEDGLQFAESIHDMLDHDHCRVIMISSGSTPVEVDQCQKHGIGRFMTKPVIASELLNEVLRQFGKFTPINPAPVQESRSPRAEARRVLLVEDNEINRRVALGLLHKRGHEVTVAENGLEAVTALADREFDVVLMDMQMPVMDGFEATATIRNREHQTGGHIPIVAMTAEALKGDRERCLSSGMDDYVSKPIAPDELYRAVEKFPALCLAGEHGAQTTSEAVSTSKPHVVEQRASPLDEMSSEIEADDGDASTPILDWNVASVRLGGTELLAEFADLFRSQTPGLVADLHRAIESHNIDLLRRSAHTLKGSASYFGAERLVQAALQLENLGRAGSFDGTDQMLVKVEAEVERVLAALDCGPPEPPA